MVKVVMRIGVLVIVRMVVEGGGEVRGDDVDIWTSIYSST